MPIRPPFPYFGVKTAVASVVWEALGDVKYYIEPFCGSAAVFINRPAEHKGHYEIINDFDCLIANFWRSLKYDPATIIKESDYPVIMADMLARQKYIIKKLPGLRAKVIEDPEYYDAKIGGWWVWGMSQYIGGGWCATNATGGVSLKRPNISRRLGLHAVQYVEGSDIASERINAMARRLRHAMILCGDWKQGSHTPSILRQNCGVFLDPPYGGGSGRKMGIYNQDSATVAKECLDFCKKYGTIAKIALCGYDGEHNILEDMGWGVYKWTASSGLSNLATKTQTGKENRNKERIWFSPVCNKVTSEEKELFSVEQ